MQAIIFGINSQDGFYLKNTLMQKGISVIGVSRGTGNWIQGNVANYSFVNSIIKSNKPGFIFHLAANSATRHDVLFENHETIATGTLNILESVKNNSPLSKVFITGSGVQFKNKGLPISETDEFEGNSPYSISRIQSVYAARYYRGLGIKTYVGYLFHHESPLRKEHHISKLTTNFIKSLKHNQTNKLQLGDTSVRKEWVFAEDVAEGIFTLCNQDSVFEACIGSGLTYSINDWLIECFAIANLDKERYIEFSDTNFKAEYPILVSNPATIKTLGWDIKTDFKTLANIMMR